jgi:hypothetical protein
LKIPDLQQVVAFNASIRESDEWFEEPDELERIEIILAALSDESEPVRAAAVAISRIARSQAFTEGNKRTALLVGIWILQNNGENPARWRGHLEHSLAKPSKVSNSKHHAAINYREMPSFFSDLKNRFSKKEI